MAVVLIVDDEVFIRGVAELMVQELGHQTLATSGVEEALAYLQSPQPIDALFTDIRLKSNAQGGFELARRAMELRPDLRVLYTTGNSITEAMKSLFVEDAHFMQKPYTPAQLQNSMDKLFAAPL